MQEIFNLLIGCVILILGWPIGNLLAKWAGKEEIKAGRKWFKMLVYLGLILGFVGLIILNDVLLFVGFFIAIVTSRSLVSENKKNKDKQNKKNKTL